MESASPEPPRPGPASRTVGAPAQGPATADDPPLPPEESIPPDRMYRVVVADEQPDGVDVDHLGRLARHVLARLDVPTELELAVTCVDIGQISDLNVGHLGGSGPTDVLAFPIDGVDDVTPGVPGMLGDVVVCPRVAAAQAPDHGRTTAGEIDLLVVHGILHLLGHDHAEEDERRRMFTLTDELLASFDASETGGRR